jgi:hypothetical protein
MEINELRNTQVQLQEMIMNVLANKTMLQPNTASLSPSHLGVPAIRTSTESDREGVSAPQTQPSPETTSSPVSSVRGGETSSLAQSLRVKPSTTSAKVGSMKGSHKSEVASMLSHEEPSFVGASSPLGQRRSPPFPSNPSLAHSSPANLSLASNPAPTSSLANSTLSLGDLASIRERERERDSEREKEKRNLSSSKERNNSNHFSDEKVLSQHSPNRVIEVTEPGPSSHESS